MHLVDFSGKDARADGSVQIAMQMEVASVPRNFVITVGKNGFKAGGGVMFSEDDDCAPPLYRKLNGALSNLERATFHAGFVYLPVTSGGPTDITYESTVNNEGTCSAPIPPTFSENYFPMVKVAVPAFTTPFSAGF